MQAAFIDIGLERNAFLHTSGMARMLCGDDADAESTPSIGEMLHEGQQLLVQVTKDPPRQQGCAVDH